MRSATTAKVLSPSHSAKKKVTNLSPDLSEIASYISPKKKDRKQSPSQIKEVLITNVSNLKKKNKGNKVMQNQNTPKRNKDTEMKLSNFDSIVRKSILSQESIRVQMSCQDH